MAESYIEQLQERLRQSELRERQLREALQVAVKDIEEWHEALGECLGDLDQSVLTKARAALAGSGGTAGSSVCTCQDSVAALRARIAQLERQVELARITLLGEDAMHAASRERIAELQCDNQSLTEALRRSSQEADSLLATRNELVAENQRLQAELERQAKWIDEAYHLFGYLPEMYPDWMSADDEAKLRKNIAAALAASPSPASVEHPQTARCADCRQPLYSEHHRDCMYYGTVYKSICGNTLVQQQKEKPILPASRAPLSTAEFCDQFAAETACMRPSAPLESERERRLQWVIDSLVAAGHVTQTKVDQATSIALALPQQSKESGDG